MTTRHDCLARDAHDPLAPLRAQFDLPDGVIYLDGNSLGARPKAALARAQQVIAQEWGRDLIRSWNTAGWFDLPKRLGNLPAPLIGAADGEVVVTDTTSVNLFKALAAALMMQAHDPVRAGRRVIGPERANCPTDIDKAQALTATRHRGNTQRQAAEEIGAPHVRRRRGARGSSRRQARDSAAANAARRAEKIELRGRSSTCRGIASGASGSAPEVEIGPSCLMLVLSTDRARFRSTACRRRPGRP